MVSLRGVAASQGHAHVFETMGTTVSVRFGAEIDAVGIGSVRVALERVKRVFREADSRYSLYRPGSELSQIAAGTLRLSDASEELRVMYELAIGWRNATNGAFTPHRGDGIIDLSGLVKGWAIAHAGEALTAGGLTSWFINAGGDVLTRGRAPTRPWTVGITDPEDRTQLMASVVMTQNHHAVATSGSAERGEHIWTQSPRAASEYLQVSVLAPDIVTADVLATAIVAGGQNMLDLAASTRDVEALAVDHHGILRVTPGFRSALAA
ncbi:MAG: FAD:protein FMN transferase [Microbacteriaceae bacterium]